MSEMTNSLIRPWREVAPIWIHMSSVSDSLIRIKERKLCRLRSSPYIFDDVQRVVQYTPRKPDCLRRDGESCRRNTRRQENDSSDDFKSPWQNFRWKRKTTLQASLMRRYFDIIRFLQTQKLLQLAFKKEHQRLRFDNVTDVIRLSRMKFLHFPSIDDCWIDTNLKHFHLYPLNISNWTLLLRLGIQVKRADRHSLQRKPNNEYDDGLE